MANVAFFTIGLLRAPYYDSLIASFGELLGPTWEAAESGSGFVALSKQEEASGDRIWGTLAFPTIFQKDEYAMRLLSTVSIWHDLESVYAFSYNGLHGDAFRRRKEWFVQTDGPGYVAWWVGDDHTPTWREACIRYDRLYEVGSHAEAFDFKQPFSADGLPAELDRKVIQQKATGYKRR